MRSLESEMINVRDSMLHMRNEGCTNAEIAERIGTTRATVIRYIGKQPVGLRKEPVRHVECENHDGNDNPPPAPCLALRDREIHLEGQFATYTVQGSSGMVMATLHGKDSILMSADELSVFIRELSAIQRNLSSVKVGAEMW